MKYRLTESAKTKYFTAIAILSYVGMMIVFGLQGLGVM